MIMWQLKTGVRTCHNVSGQMPCMCRPIIQQWHCQPWSATVNCTQSWDAAVETSLIGDLVCFSHAGLQLSEPDSTAFRTMQPSHIFKGRY